jgi:hypothetical protein
LLHIVSLNVILFDGQRKREGKKNHIKIQNLKISLFPTTQQKVMDLLKNISQGKEKLRKTLMKL